MAGALLCATGSTFSAENLASVTKRNHGHQPHDRLVAVADLSSNRKRPPPGRRRSNWRGCARTGRRRWNRKPSRHGRVVDGQTLLLGNAVLAIEDDGAGRPVRLRPIPWAQSNPQILADGRVVFNVSSGGFSPWWPGHMPVRVASDDVLWLRDRPDANGVFGRSALSRCPEVLSLAACASKPLPRQPSTRAQS